MKELHVFKSNISSIGLPEKFTFPFYYQPHKLAKIAAKELQNYLNTQTDFTHNFGLDNPNGIGKMFGVLVVKTKNNQLGFIAAFSGKLTDNCLPNYFVPPVYNRTAKGSFYIKGEQKLERIIKEIETIRTNNNFISLNKKYTQLKQEIEADIKHQKEKIKKQKKARKALKKEQQHVLSAKDFIVLETKLTQESYNNQFFIKELQAYYALKLSKISTQLQPYTDQLAQLKQQRKAQSNYLQNTLFKNYAFLNRYKHTKSLLDIFNNPEIKPPAGAGDCAAPKLLQFAFANNLTPITMAEFWWGASPNSAIRKHKNFYPACQSRCKPILAHMLQGLPVDENTLLKTENAPNALDIIYEDDALIAINKPSEFLSVPGKTIKDSVYTRIKNSYKNATGPLIVHRLDMSTSGIILLTKTKEANKNLQSQFINRTVKKTYIAVLDGVLKKNSGLITLPLRLDIDDRPKQLVDFKDGKKAVTKWKKISVTNNKTRVNFYPITGRTHQLRVHAAHKNGLNLPIVGDDLYGTKQERLLLHAAEITFIHPTTKEKMQLAVAPNF